jgi:hypothetical protein
MWSGVLCVGKGRKGEGRGVCVVCREGGERSVCVCVSVSVVCDCVCVCIYACMYVVYMFT